MGSEIRNLKKDRDAGEGGRPGGVTFVARHSVRIGGKKARAGPG